MDSHTSDRNGGPAVLPFPSCRIPGGEPGEGTHSVGETYDILVADLYRAPPRRE